MSIALVVPVMKRFELFTELIKSIDYEIKPYVIDNWNYNRGVSAAWNLGIRKAFVDKNRYALIVNDDVIFQPGCIEKLYDSIKKTEACMISANPNEKITPSGILKDKEDYFCFIVDIPQLVNNCGIFDENFYPAYFEDNDMRYRIKLAGLQSYMNTDAIAFHHGSATQNFDPVNKVVSDHQFRINEKYFVEKWGGPPWKETYTNPFNDPSKRIWDWQK